MVRLTALIAAAVTLTTYHAFAQSGWPELNKPVSGFFRLCNDEDALATLRRHLRDTTKANDYSSFRIWYDSFKKTAAGGLCIAGNFIITPFQENRDLSGMSWNYVYDPHSTEDTCDLPIDGQQIKVPCRRAAQPAHYFYSYYTPPDSGRIVVIAEIFQTNLVQQYLDAQNGLPASPK